MSLAFYNLGNRIDDLETRSANKHRSFSVAGGSLTPDFTKNVRLGPAAVQCTESAPLDATKTLKVRQLSELW